MKTINQKQAVQAIANLEPFKAGSLTGEWVRVSFYSGRLNVSHPELANLCETLNKGESAYVVFSYSTPIAYATEKWHTVTEKFSPTTSRHQSIVRKAVA